MPFLFRYVSPELALFANSLRCNDVSAAGGGPTVVGREFDGRI